MRINIALKASCICGWKVAERQQDGSKMEPNEVLVRAFEHSAQTHHPVALAGTTVIIFKQKEKQLAS